MFENTIPRDTDRYEWTKPRCAKLEKLWADGLSCSRIAAELGSGLTRNAVIGKVRRLGLVRRWTADDAERRKLEEQERSTTRRLKARRLPTNAAKSDTATTRRLIPSGAGVRMIESPVIEPEAIASMLDPAAIPFERRKRLLDLKDDDCRFPYGDVGDVDFFFCGAVKTEGSSYCNAHALIARGRSHNVSEKQLAARSFNGRR